MNKKNFPIFISLLIVSLFFTVVFYYAYTNINASESHMRAKNFYDARLSEDLSKREIEKLNEIDEVEIAGGTSSAAKSAKLNDNLLSIVGQDLETNEMREFSYLIDGRFPVNKSEIVLDESIVKNENLKIGDEIEIEFGNRFVNGEVIDARSIYTNEEKFEETSTKKFTLVGINKNIYNENLKIHYGLKLIDEGEELIPFIKFKDFKSSYENRDDIENKIVNILGKNVELNFNESWINYYGININPYQNLITKLINILSIGICLALFVFFIKNIFWVWSIRKIRELSMYKSIGSTDFQIYKILLKEAIWISIVPILIGHAVGFIIIKYVYKLATSGKAEVVFFENVNFNIMLSAVTILVSFLVVLFAVIFPARKISKINIIDGLKGNFDFGKNSKKKRNSNLWKELRLNNLANIKSQRYISSLGIIIIAVFAIILSISVYYRDFYYFDDGYDIRVKYYSKNGEIPTILKDILKEFNGNGYISKEKYIEVKNKLELSEEAKNKNLDSKLEKHMKNSNTDYLEGKIIALEKEDLEKIGGKAGEFTLYNKVQENENEPIRKANRVKYFKNPRKMKIGIADDTSFDINIYNSIESLGAYEERILPFQVVILTDFNNYNNYINEYKIEKHANYPFELRLKVDKNLEESKNYIKNKIESSITYDESFNLYTKDELKEAEYTDVESFKTIIYAISLIIFLLNITNGYSSINISLMSRRKEIGTLYSIGMDKENLKKKYEKEFLLEQIKSLIFALFISIIFMIVVASLFKSIDFRNLILYFPYLEFILFSVLVYAINFIIYKFSLKNILKLDPIKLIK